MIQTKAHQGYLCLEAAQTVLMFYYLIRVKTLPKLISAALVWVYIILNLLTCIRKQIFIIKPHWTLTILTCERFLPNALKKKKSFLEKVLLLVGQGSKNSKWK